MFSLDDQIVTHLFLDIVTDLALPGKLFLYLFATCLLSFKTQTHQTDIRELEEMKAGCCVACVSAKKLRLNSPRKTEADGQPACAPV